MNLNLLIGSKRLALALLLALGAAGCGDDATKSTACDESPCMNGGACYADGSDDFFCACPEGFGGKDCSSIVTDVELACAESPCQNGGTCYANADVAYLCVCPAGYSGVNCEVPPNDELGFGVDGAFVLDVGGFDDRSRDVVARADDSVVFVGSAEPVADADVDAMVVIVDAYGEPDAAFGTGGRLVQDFGYNDEALFTVAYDEGSDTVAAGGYVNGDKTGTGAANRESLLFVLPPSGTPVFEIVSLSADGDDRINDVAFGEVDGTTYIYAAGYVADAGGEKSLALARFTMAGALDATFGAGGVAVLDVASDTSNYEEAKGVGVQADGKIVVAGVIEAPSASATDDSDVVLVRFTTDGQVDDTFGPNGDGTVTLSFGPGFGGGSRDQLWDADVDADGNLVLFGWRSALDGGGAPQTYTNRVVARVLADGSGFDTTFGEGGIYTLSISTLSLTSRAGFVQPDGKILSSGYHAMPTLLGTQTANAILLVRLNADGTPDTTFGEGGVLLSNPFAKGDEAWGMAEAYGATMLSNGDYVTGGYGREAPTGKVDLVSFKYKPDGTRYVTSGY